MVGEAKMKAWFVWVGSEWGDWVHGANATEAKKMFWNWWASEAEEWTYLGPIRCPWLDNVPITRETIALEFSPGEIDEYEIKYRDLICKCEICSEAKNENNV